jgi:hypothetical protein
VNINITVECETCGEKTNCRIGMSNREEQPFRFCCQSCGSPIDMTLRQSKGGEFHGAMQIQPDLYPFDDKTNFVDLSLDFPVAFGKYVMGKTPFMEAFRRIGHEAMGLHGSRLAYLIAMAQAGAKVIGCDLNPSTERDVTNVARFLDIEMMS